MNRSVVDHGPPPHGSPYGPEEWATRVDLAACYRLIAHFGMSELISNHISARVPGTHDQFLINPFGLMYEEITASCLVRVDLHGNILYNPNPDLGINRAGFVIHSAVHEARPDAGCVIHTHTPAGIAISTLKCGILPISQSAMRFARIAYHDFEGVAFNEGERERLARDLGDAEVMVLRNHGLLALGAGIPQAFNNMFRLERICQIQLMAMACQAEILMPDAQVIARANDAYARNEASMGNDRPAQALGVLEWPAMLRLLDRRDPSYRT
jgi:ribulose-5-phosphate 4-epimerase/fuculose-1-phosphate aldolase